MYDSITISETHLDDTIDNESIYNDGFHPLYVVIEIDMVVALL